MVGFEMALAWEVLLYHVPPLHGGRCKAGALYVWANSYITLQLPQQTTNDCEYHMTFNSYSHWKRHRLASLCLQQCHYDVILFVAGSKGDSRKRLMRASKSPASMASRSDTHPAEPSGVKKPQHTDSVLTVFCSHVTKATCKELVYVSDTNQLCLKRTHVIISRQ